ncbi:MAG: methyl-accepting chemotaxis protein [Pseudomonadota bacterium]
MNQERTYKRKILNFSVNRAMQLRMIGKLISIILVSLLISGGVYYHYANQQITASFMLFHIKARNFLDFLLPVVGISFVISLVVGTIASLFFPKNVAGALYRIEEDVRRITEGDLTVQITLRSGDEGVSLAEQLNQMVALFRETIVSVQDSLHQAQKVCGTGPEMISTEHLAELQASLGQIAQEINKLKVVAEK